jgi:nucleoid DNA-binding protein
MNKTYTSKDIAGILAERTGRKKDEIEKFIEALLGAANERIIRNQVVQIKDIGVFRVNLIKEHKRIDVNTQKTITIPAHHRLSFTPDKKFAEQVNRQFSFFEIVESQINEKSHPKFREDDDDNEENISKTEESNINNQTVIIKKEKMEEKRYPMPPVPANIAGEKVADETENLYPEEKQPEIADENNGDKPILSEDGTTDEPVDEQTQLIRMTDESGNAPDEQLHEQIPLMDDSLDDLQNEEIPLTGAPADETPDEQTQFVDNPFGNLQDEEILLTGGTEEELPDDERTQMISCPLGDDPENEEDQTLFMAPNEKTEESTTPDSYVKEDRPTATNRPGSKKSSLSPTCIALAVVLLIVLAVGAIYIVSAYRGTSSPFGKGNSGRISGGLTLPGDSAALEQMQQKAKIDSEANADTTAVSEASAAVPTTEETPATVAETPEKKAKSTSSGRKTSGSQAKSSSRSAKSTATQTSSSDQVLTKVSMEQGSRLTLLALKYYDNKVFWVYIYEFNKATIGSNPDNVPAGMEILIPAKHVYKIDAKDPASVEKARQLQGKLKGRN